MLHLRDASGQEVDAVVECPDGRRLFAEVKLGGADAIEQASANLLRIARNLPEDTGRPRPALAVITAGGYAYTRQDRISVVPITTLGP